MKLFQTTTENIKISAAINIHLFLICEGTLYPQPTHTFYLHSIHRSLWTLFSLCLLLSLTSIIFNKQQLDAFSTFCNSIVSSLDKVQAFKLMLNWTNHILSIFEDFWINIRKSQKSMDSTFSLPRLKMYAQFFAGEWACSAGLISIWLEYLWLFGKERANLYFTTVCLVINFKLGFQYVKVNIPLCLTSFLFATTSNIQLQPDAVKHWNLHLLGPRREYLMAFLDLGIKKQMATKQTKLI